MAYFYLLMFVQICSESLPISSSGHLLLLDKLMHYFNVTDDSFIFLSSHPHVHKMLIHFFHISSVIILFLFFFSTYSLDFYSKKNAQQKMINMTAFIFIADSITFFWYFISKEYALYSLSLSAGFLITIVLLFSLYWVPHNNRRTISLADAFLFGVLQSIALFPGISRFALVLVGARWLGYSNKKSFVITWLLQLPLIAGASMVGGYQLYKQDLLWNFFSLPSIVLMISATIIGYLLLKVSYQLLMINKFCRFGWYMIIPFLLSLTI